MVETFQTPMFPEASAPPARDLFEVSSSPVACGAAQVEAVDGAAVVDADPIIAPSRFPVAAKSLRLVEVWRALRSLASRAASQDRPCRLARGASCFLCPRPGSP